MLSLLKETYSEWSRDKVPRLGAALAYYSIFSIAPMLIIAVAVAGMILGERAASGALDATLVDAFGETGAEAVRSMLVNANRPGAGLLASIAGFGLLLLGASGVFVQLKDALNTIWDVQEKPDQTFLQKLKHRLPTFGVVLGIGGMLIASVALTSVLDALPGNVGRWQIVNLAVSFGVTTLLFAMIFKLLPDAEIPWSDTWAGAAVTALLFTLGKMALGYYLARGSASSAFGAAGSLVTLLIWIYWSAQILLFGAEFTKVYAVRHGSRVVPKDYAETAGQGTLINLEERRRKADAQRSGKAAPR